MSVALLMMVAAFSAVLLVVAAVLMLRMSDRDTAVALRFDAARGNWVEPEHTKKTVAATGVLMALQKGLTGLGRIVMQSGILPGRTRAELQQTLSAAGFRSPNALALFVGCKLALLFGLPFAMWVASQRMGLSSMTGIVVIGASAVAGMMAPDMTISRMRKRYLARLEIGLSDALDLMVICAQAGLSLEPAMARVSVELRSVHPEMCLELAVTVRELEIMADSAAALSNMGKRTGLESLMRLAATLTQTMQYGTPLTDALRTLSNEMRTISLTKFEERAARLPVLLTMPMILFILPCTFMIVGGPAGLQVARSMGLGG